MSKYQVEEGELFDDVPASEVVPVKERRTDITPPITTDAEGKITITGFVDDVVLDGYTYNKEKNVATFFFKDKDGNSLPKWINSPHHREDIQKITDPAVKQERIGYTYMEVKSMFKSFIYSNAVEEVANSLPQKNLRILSQALWDLFESGKSRIPNKSVSIKVVFKAETGHKPVYNIANSRNWIGTTGDENWGPKFITKEQNEKFYDKVTFEPIPADPDFADPSDSQTLASQDDINSVFAETPISDTETLNTPEVDLLG